MNTFSFEAIGTHWRIDIYSSLSPSTFEYLQLLIQKRIDEFEKSYSRFRADSYINLILTQTGEHTLPRDAGSLFSLYQKLYAITGGLFTPLIGNVLIDAGYDSEYSLKGKQLHTPPPLETVMEYHFPTIEIKKEEIFDFGACGKGYLIDLVSEIIKDQGIVSFCVDAGGDIRYEHTEPLQVGLENPHNVEQAIGIVGITHTSLCASAGSRRKWGSYHHIINPLTLSSPSHIAATWVMAKNTITADALATCLFLVGPTILTPHFSFEYLILFSDSTFKKSSGFVAELFLK